jgi:transcriptional regulator with XRE-family HTH domain
MTHKGVGSGDPLDWDVADRMRKTLRCSGYSVHDMAEYLGVSRNAVSTWINGHVHPSKQTLRLWAIRTGVTYEWLAGEEDESGQDRVQKRVPVILAA